MQLLLRPIRKFQGSRKGHRSDGNRATPSVPYPRRQPHMKVAQNQLHFRRGKYKWRSQTSGQSHTKAEHQQTKEQIKKGERWLMNSRNSGGHLPTHTGKTTQFIRNHTQKRPRQQLLYLKPERFLPKSGKLFQQVAPSCLIHAISKPP